jgi:hypothetical protein
LHSAAAMKTIAVILLFAQNPIMCHLELAFCANGKAGFSNYDEPEQGTYYLEGPAVDASVKSSPNSSASVAIELDSESGAATGAGTTTYILDTAERWNTLDFDPGIVCSGKEAE